MPAELTERIFTAVDARDAKEFAAFFADSGRLTFGNAEPLTGRDAIAEAIGEFFATIKGLRHQVRNEWVTGPDTVAELTVTYRRLDGNSVTVPAVSIWHLDSGGKIDDYRIFVDLTPVYAP